jgi:hypothetical protein
MYCFVHHWQQAFNPAINPARTSESKARRNFSQLFVFQRNKQQSLARRSAAL